MDAAIIAIFFAKLTKAIDALNVSRVFGSVWPWADEAGNKVPSPAAKDFMFMGKLPNGTLTFKHSGSRNYVMVKPCGSLEVPKTDDPFFRGYF